MTPTQPETQKLDALTSDDVRRLSESRGEPSWMSELRVKAWTAYAGLPWPKRNDEGWQRTDLKVLEFPSLKLSERAPDGALRLSPAAPAGVRVSPLAEAIRNGDTDVRNRLEKAVASSPHDKFLSLTLALASDGWVIRVSRSSQPEAPLHSELIFRAPGTALFVLNIVVLEPESRLAFGEELSGAPGSAKAGSFLSTLTQIDLGAGAALEHLKLQHLDPGVSFFGWETVSQARGSRMKQMSLAGGAKLSRTVSRVALNEPEAESDMMGILFGDERQQFDHWAFEDHVAPHTTSRLEYRGALKGTARSSFIGLVKIEKEAQKSDAYQSNRNLLLSREARADATPKLEIIANDVRCGHGSATGPVDKDQIFYLMSRGLDRPEAERMIVEGFFEPVVSKIPEGPVAERVRALLKEKLTA